MKFTPSSCAGKSRRLRWSQEAQEALGGLTLCPEIVFIWLCARGDNEALGKEVGGGLLHKSLVKRRDIRFFRPLRIPRDSMKRDKT